MLPLFSSPLLMMNEESSLSSFLHHPSLNFCHQEALSVPVGTAEQVLMAISQLVVRVPCISWGIECLADFYSSSPSPQCVWAFYTSLISCSLLEASALSFSGTFDMTCRRLKQHKALENRSHFSSHVWPFQAVTHLYTLRCPFCLFSQLALLRDQETGNLHKPSSVPDSKGEDMAC